MDGLLRTPPDSSTTREDLITEWCPSTVWEGKHNTAVDVTGGIGLKAERGALVKEICPHVSVLIINGEVPHRVHGALVGQDVIGTKVRARL